MRAGGAWRRRPFAFGASCQALLVIQTSGCDTTPSFDIVSRRSSEAMNSRARSGSSVVSTIVTEFGFSSSRYRPASDSPYSRRTAPCSSNPGFQASKSATSWRTKMVLMLPPPRASGRHAMLRSASVRS